MIFDKQLMFSDQQEVPPSKTTDATNILDIGPAKVGASDLRLVVTLADGIEGAGIITVEVKTSGEVTEAGDLKDSRNLAKYIVGSDIAQKGGPIVNTCLPATADRYIKVSYAISGAVNGLVATAGLVLDCETH